MYIKINISTNVRVDPKFFLEQKSSQIALTPLSYQNFILSSQHLVLSAFLRTCSSINLGRRNYYKCECIKPPILHCDCKLANHIVPYGNR
jgi:hypothetical protein